MNSNVQDCSLQHENKKKSIHHSLFFSALHNFQSNVISVIKDIPENKILNFGSCGTDKDGSNIRIGREILFLYKNEDVSHFELLNSEGKRGI